MRIKDYKCRCGNDDFFFATVGNQNGIYCSYCGKWLKWANKNELNLRMKQSFNPEDDNLLSPEELVENNKDFDME